MTRLLPQPLDFNGPFPSQSRRLRLGIVGGGRIAATQAMAARMKQGATPAVTFQAFLGNDFPTMARNQVRNLQERRIRTVSYVCEV